MIFRSDPADMKALTFLSLLAAPLALLAGVRTNAVPFAATTLGTPVVHDGYLYLPADTFGRGGFAVFDLEEPAAPSCPGAGPSQGWAYGPLDSPVSPKVSCHLPTGQ